MLFMTANKAGYIAVSFPWLVVMMLYMDWLGLALFKVTSSGTYMDQKVGISPVEILESNAWW
jgi:hypothetical protein